MQTQERTPLDPAGTTAQSELPQRLAAGEIVDFGVRHGRFKTERLIGHGSYGMVYQMEKICGKDVPTPAPSKMALKRARVPVTFRSIIARKAFVWDLEHTWGPLLTNLRHKHLVQHYASKVTSASHDEDGTMCLDFLMELCSDGSLRGAINRTLYVDVKAICSQIILGLTYLHELGVVHTDLKPDNILVQRRSYSVAFDTEFRVKIADLEDCFTLGPHDGSKRVKGTVPYIAPEILQKGSKPDQFSDVYSFGVLAQELVMRITSAPLDAQSLSGSVDLGSGPNNLSVATPNEVAVTVFRSFLDSCMAEDRDERASAKELLTHPWLTSYGFLEEIERNGLPPLISIDWADASLMAAWMHLGGVYLDPSPPISAESDYFSDDQDDVARRCAIQLIDQIGAEIARTLLVPMDDRENAVFIERVLPYLDLPVEDWKEASAISGDLIDTKLVRNYIQAIAFVYPNIEISGPEASALLRMIHVLQPLIVDKNHFNNWRAGAPVDEKQTSANEDKETHDRIQKAAGRQAEAFEILMLRLRIMYKDPHGGKTESKKETAKRLITFLIASSSGESTENGRGYKPWTWSDAVADEYTCEELHQVARGTADILLEVFLFVIYRVLQTDTKFDGVSQNESETFLGIEANEDKYILQTSRMLTEIVSDLLSHVISKFAGKGAESEREIHTDRGRTPRTSRVEDKESSERVRDEDWLTRTRIMLRFLFLMASEVVEKFNGAENVVAPAAIFCAGAAWTSERTRVETMWILVLMMVSMGSGIPLECTSESDTESEFGTLIRAHRNDDTADNVMLDDTARTSAKDLADILLEVVVMTLQARFGIGDEVQTSEDLTELERTRAELPRLMTSLLGQAVHKCTGLSINSHIAATDGALFGAASLEDEDWSRHVMNETDRKKLRRLLMHIDFTIKAGHTERTIKSELGCQHGAPWLKSVRLHKDVSSEEVGMAVDLGRLVKRMLTSTRRMENENDPASAGDHK